LDPETTDHFARIVELAKAILDNVNVITDSTPERAILRIEAEYRGLRVIAAELLVAGKERKYSYYVLQGNDVVAGFDNSPDPRALRQKYGRIGSLHERMPIPHMHTEGKQDLELTEEFFFHSFLEWLSNYASKT